MPMATAVLVVVFDALLVKQYLDRRKVHQVWWAVGFGMYAAAALLEAVTAMSGGWNPWLFRLYALISASLVAVLAQGSMALVSRKHVWSRIYLVYNAVCLAAFAFGVNTTPLVAAELAAPKLSSYAALGGTAFSYPRVMSMLLTIPATFVLLGAAIRSIVRFLRKREFAYRVWANVLIAAGTLTIASGGGMAKAGNSTLFYLAEMVAAALFFAGFRIERGSSWSSPRVSPVRTGAERPRCAALAALRVRPSGPAHSQGETRGYARTQRSPRR
jgi:hypothetical protein